jgi:hypothetical protein
MATQDFKGTISFPAGGALTGVSTAAEINTGTEAAKAIAPDQLAASSPTVVKLTLSGGQLTFPASQSASADANTLDDYEEGTWTPVLSFGGLSVGITYANRGGIYTKIGKQVTVTMIMELSSKGTSVGQVAITGLPFAVNAAYYAPVALLTLAVSFANQMMGYVIANSAVIGIYESTEAGAVTALTDTDFANNSYVYLSITYLV